MKSNISNLIIKIVFGIALVISLFLIISGLTEEEEIDDNSNEILETGINVSTNNIKMEVGSEQEISANVIPTNATYQNLTWEVGNQSIISLNNGVVKGLSSGSTFIKITTEKQKISRIINVTVVTNAIPITEIKPIEDKIELYVGDSKKIEYTIVPSDATNKKVSYSIDNKEVAGFNKEGHVVGVKEGSAIVTLKSNNGISASVTIKVNKREVEVTGVKVDKKVVIILQHRYMLLLKIKRYQLTLLVYL